MRLRSPIIAIAGLAAIGAVAVVTAIPSSGTPAAHAATTKKVTFGEYFYKPKKVTIAVGDSVRFVNVGKIEHTVADSSKSGSIRSTVIKPRPLKHGASQTVRFKKAGTIYYLCTFHPTLMRGVVVVR